MQETTYVMLLAYGRIKKLPTPEPCHSGYGRGKVKRMAKLVEVRWKMLWTRVRLPPTPLLVSPENAEFLGFL